MNSFQTIGWEQVGFGIGFVGVFYVLLALALRALVKKYNTRRRWRTWAPAAQVPHGCICRYCYRQKSWQAGKTSAIFSLDKPFHYIQRLLIIFGSDLPPHP